MKKTWKAVVVGLALGAIAGVASATLGKQEATAMPCCSSCDARYEYCISQCAPDDYACWDACDASTMSCYRWCSMSC